MFIDAADGFGVTVREVTENFDCHPCNRSLPAAELEDAWADDCVHASGRMSMRSNQLKRASIAAAAAAFAISAMPAFAAEPPAGSKGRAVNAEDAVHCYGVNSCKGTADCATSLHECKGQNACKGQGFKGLKAGECLTKGGTIGDLG